MRRAVRPGANSGCERGPRGGRGNVVLLPAGRRGAPLGHLDDARAPESQGRPCLPYPVCDGPLHARETCSAVGAGRTASFGYACGLGCAIDPSKFPAPAARAPGLRPPNWLPGRGRPSGSWGYQRQSAPPACCRPCWGRVRPQGLQAARPGPIAPRCGLWLPKTQHPTCHGAGLNPSNTHRSPPATLPRVGYGHKGLTVLTHAASPGPFGLRPRWLPGALRLMTRGLCTPWAVSIGRPAAFQPGPGRRRTQSKSPWLGAGYGLPPCTRRWSAGATYSKEFYMYDEINPSTGLPMVGGIGGIDVGGSPWGAIHPWSSSYPDSSDFDR